MKPNVICHIMSSVDGKLLNERWTAPYDAQPAELYKIYAALGRELDTDAWMFGKNTVRAMFPYKLGTAGHPVTADTPAVFMGERRSERLFIVADPESDIYFTAPTIRGDNMLVIVGRNTTEEYLAHLREQRISYVIIPDANDLKTGLETVGQVFGIRKLSVQGGGILNGALLAAGLVDELSLVIYPGIDGLSGIPSIFEYIGGATEHPAQGQRLQLISALECEHGVMWLRYKFQKA